jgi:spore coat protein U-like protein
MEVLQMSSFRLRLALLSAAVGALYAGPAAMAATTTGGFQVFAQVEAQCEVDSSTTDMDFGIVDVTAGATATSTLAYRCTTGTQPSAALDYDVMTSGAGGTLAYTLYQDSGLTTVWNSTATRALPAATGFASADTVTVWGEITTAQAQADGVSVGGDYVDDVTVTLTF